MATAKAQDKIITSVDELPRIQKYFNKTAATLSIAILIIIATHLVVEGLAGRVELFLALDKVFFEGLTSIIILPLIISGVVLLYMVFYSDHRNIQKSRFDIHTRWSLTDNRVGDWLVKRRWFQSLFTILVSIPLVALIFFGIYGYGGYIQQADAGFINGASFITWNIWWVGIIFTFPLLGRVWCTICPIGAIGEWAHRTHKPRHLSFISYLMRYTLAGLFSIIGFMITGVTFGLILLGKDIELLTGPITELTGGFSLTSVAGFIAYQIQAPFYLVSAMLTVVLETNFPISSLVVIVWFNLSIIASLIAGTFGFVIKDFLIAAIWGSPLRQDEDPSRPYPKKLRTLWITLILYTGIMIFDFAVGMFVNPLFTALFIGLLVAVSIGLGLIYERRAFCLYVCPLAAIIGMYGATATIELRNKDMKVCSRCKTKDCLNGRAESYGYSALSPDIKVNFEWPAGYACPMGEFTMIMESNIGCIMCTECIKACRNDNIEIALRPPFLDLFLKKKKRFDEASLAAVLIGLTLALLLPGAPEVASLFDSFKENFLIGVLHIPNNYFGISLAEYVSLIIWFIFAAFLIPIGGLLLASLIALKIGNIETMNSKQMLTLFSYSILPLGLASHAAYWIVRFFEHSPSFVKILADPFANQFMGFSIYNLEGLINLNNPITLPIALIYTLNPFFYLFRDLPRMSLFPEDIIYFIRIMVIFIGLTFSIFSSYKVAIRNFGHKDKNRALLILIPFVIYMVIFTSLIFYSGRSWSPF